MKPDTFVMRCALVITLVTCSEAFFKAIQNDDPWYVCAIYGVTVSFWFWMVFKMFTVEVKEKC